MAVFAFRQLGFGCLLLILVLCSAGAAQAAGQLLIDDGSWRPGDIAVVVNISNPESIAIGDYYRSPLSDPATISRMKWPGTMWVPSQ